MFHSFTLYNDFMQIKSRLNWSQQEDRQLKFLREDLQQSSWIDISANLELKFLKKRTPKQCRQRYNSISRFVDSPHQKGDWSLQEDELLGKLYIQQGSKWSQFTEYFQSRSQNSIKNRFYSRLRRICRKICEVQKKDNPYQRTLIKTENILTLLEICMKIKREVVNFLNFKEGLIFQLFEIRKILVKFQVQQDNTLVQTQLLGLSDKIHQINSCLRSLGVFRLKNIKNLRLDCQRISLISLNLEEKVKKQKMVQKIIDEESPSSFDTSEIKNDIQMKSQQASISQLSQGGLQLDQFKESENLRKEQFERFLNDCLIHF